MTTNIRANGSKFSGQPHDPIEALFDRLHHHALDPRFEQLGNFVLSAKDGKIHFYGNFYSLSALFDILTDDQGLIGDLIYAIRRNQEGEAYQQAKAERAAA